MAEPGRTPLVGGIIGWAVPEVLRNVDTDELLDTLDVDAIVARLDINEVADRLDLDALMERLDMDALVDRLDVNKIAEQLDLDALMEGLDMDALVDRLDVNKIAEQLDLDALMEQIDITSLMGRGTQEVAEGSLDFVRRQLVRFDALIAGLASSLMRRDRSADPEGPVGLMPEASHVGINTARPVDRRDVSGHYAGVVSRGAGLLLDWVGALTSFGLLGAVITFLIATIFNSEFTVTTDGWFGRVLLAVWLLLWYWVPLVVAGRTPAMVLVGLRVVRRSGHRVRGPRALVRTLVLPLSTLIFLISYLGVLFDREHRALEDLVSGTVVVYDWGRRTAEQPPSLLAKASQMVRDNRDADASTTDRLAA